MSLQNRILLNITLLVQLLHLGILTAELNAQFKVALPEVIVEEEAKVKTSKETELKDFDVLKVEGPFNKAAESLGKVVKLKWLGDKLGIELPKTYQDAGPALREVYTAAGGGGGGTGNDKYWAQYFYGRELSGIINKGTYPYGGAQLTEAEKNNKERFRVLVMEITDRGRELMIQGVSAKDFHLTINGGLDPYLLHMRQEKSGVVLVQEVTPNSSFAGKGLTFEHFAQQHPDFVEKRLFPTLKRHGIACPKTAFNPLVREHVLAKIQGVDDERESAFKKEFAAIDSANFKEREAASKLMEKNFDEWKDLILRLMDDPEYSFEARMRMTKIYQEKCSPEEKALIMENSKKIPKTRDPGYLLWLAKQVGDSKIRETIMAQLAIVTSQKLDNMGAWDEWYGSTKEGRERSRLKVKHIDLVSDSGVLKQLAKPVSTLASLRFKGSKLELDRGQWSSHFGGKTVRELVAEVKKDVDAKNLPSQWFNASTSHANPSVEYAHVLFQKIQYKCPTRHSGPFYNYGSMFSYRYTNVNRHFELASVLATLDMQSPRKRNQPSTNDAEMFRLCLRGRVGGLQSLSVHESKQKRVSVMLTGLEANSILSFSQDQDGKCVWHDVRGDQAKTLKADNFQKLYQENKDYFESQGYPTLASFGININSEADSSNEKQLEEKKTDKGTDDPADIQPFDDGADIARPRVTVPQLFIPRRADP